MRALKKLYRRKNSPRSSPPKKMTEEQFYGEYERRSMIKPTDKVQMENSPKLQMELS